MSRCRYSKNIFSSQSGASLIEYALTLGAVSVLSIGLVAGYSGKVQELFGGESNSIQVATNNLGAKGGGGLGGSGDGSGEGSGGGLGGGGGQTNLLETGLAISVDLNEEAVEEEEGFYFADAEGSATIDWAITDYDDFYVTWYLSGSCEAISDEFYDPDFDTLSATGSEEITDDGSLTGCSFHAWFWGEDVNGEEEKSVHIDFAEVAPPPPYTIDVTLDGDQTFKVIGPGDSVDLDWAIATEDDEAYPNREIRNINGICPLEGGNSTTVPLLTIDEGLTGHEVIEWDEDYVDCFVEFTFGVTDEWSPNSFLENKTVVVAFTDFRDGAPPVQTMTLNGVEEGDLDIGVGQTAEFAWNSTFPIKAPSLVSKSFSCSSIPVGSTIPQSGSLEQAWNGTVSGCTITLCLTGQADWDSESVESCATAHFISADTTPDAMVFPTMFDAATSTLVSSNTVTVSGINTATTLTISAGGSVSKNGGTAVTGSVTVNNGDTIQIKHTTSSSASADANITLTKTGFATNWRVLNTSADQTPTMGNFTAKTGQPVATLVTSNIVVPSAYAAMPISVTNGKAVINNGGSTGKLTDEVSSGVMNSGNGIFLTTTSSPLPNTTKTVTVNYGPGLSLSKTWDVTTRVSDDDTMPTPFIFNTDMENSNSTTTITQTIKPTGFDTPFYLTVVDPSVSARGGDSSVTVCINNVCGDGGMVNPGDLIRLEMDAETICEDIDYYLAVDSEGLPFAQSYWTACPWFGPDEEDLTCEADTVTVGTLNPKVVSLPEGYLGQVYPKRWITEGPGMVYGDQEYYFSCGATEWSFDRAGAGCHNGIGGDVDPATLDGEVFAKNKDRCANWMAQVHGAALTCSAAQATNMSACVTANSPTPPTFCHRSFDGEDIICPDSDSNNDGLSDWYRQWTVMGVVKG